MSIRYVNLDLERSPVGLGLRKIAQWVAYSDFTDGGSTAGTLTLTPTLPAGAFVLGTKVTVTSAFTGDTSAALVVGKSSGQDEFSDGASINVFTTGDKGESPEDPLEFLAAATTVYLQITSASDWTLVTAGRMLVEIFYLSSEPEVDESYPDKNKYTV